MAEESNNDTGDNFLIILSVINIGNIFGTENLQDVLVVFLWMGAEFVAIAGVQKKFIKVFYFGNVG